MTRVRLPDRRETETFEFSFRYRPFTISLSRDDASGELREIFLSGAKSGEDYHSLLRDAAIIASLAMQYGCPIEALRASISRGEDQSPHSVIGAALDAAAGKYEVL